MSADESKRHASIRKVIGGSTSRHVARTGTASAGVQAWADGKRLTSSEQKKIQTKISGKVPGSSPSIAQSPFTSNKYSGERGVWAGIGITWGGKTSFSFNVGPIINRSGYGLGMKFDKDGVDLIGTKLGLKELGKVKSKTLKDALNSLMKKKKGDDTNGSQSASAGAKAKDDPTKSGSGSAAPDGVTPEDDFGPPPTDDNKGGEGDGPEGASAAMPRPDGDGDTDGLTGMRLGFGRDQPKVVWAPKVPTGPATDPVDPVSPNATAPDLDPETGPARELLIDALLPKKKTRRPWGGPGGGDPDPNAPTGGGTGSEPADTATGTIEQPIVKMPPGIIDPSGW